MYLIVGQTQSLFAQINAALQLISTEQYVHCNTLMGSATIGQHVRHIIELYEEMLNGYRTGEVNYENRKRNFLIETSKDYACTQMDTITATLSLPDKNLLLSIGYATSESENDSIITTNYFREVVYNIEHTIHHMALIRIAFKSAFNIELDEEFGVAPSTLKYRKACAQ
jgi:hypothetical protein